MFSLRRIGVILIAFAGPAMAGNAALADEQTATMSTLLWRADRDSTQLIPVAGDGSFLIVSDRKKALAVRAPNKPKSGQEVRLDKACNLSIPECRWILRDGMLISARDPSLALKAWNGAQHSAVIRLSNNCSPSNADCTWMVRNGMILSKRDAGLAINAWGGADHGISLRLHNGCKSNNPDCTWTPVSR